MAFVSIGGRMRLDQPRREAQQIRYLASRDHNPATGPFAVFDAQYRVGQTVVMRTALDAPSDMLDADEANFVDKVRDYGWFATHVTEETGHPGFTYSTGFWLTFQVPEVIVFSLKSDIAHDVLWDMFRDAKAGARWPTRTSVPDIFGNTDAYLFPVAKTHYPEHLGWSRWFYGGGYFPCVQLVWPDRSALFPWQPGFDVRFSADQPDLSEKGWLSSLSQ